LGVKEDFGLLVAGLLGTILILLTDRRSIVDDRQDAPGDSLANQMRLHKR
jgi:hypothetical protein